MGAFLLAVKTRKDDVRRCEAACTYAARSEKKKFSSHYKKYGHMATMRVDGEFFYAHSFANYINKKHNGITLFSEVTAYFLKYFLISIGTSAGIFVSEPVLPKQFYEQ